MFIIVLKYQMRRIKMTFNLNNFVNFMDQVKDKDWVDDHVIIDGVSPEFQKQIKDKLRERLIVDIERERLKEDEQKLKAFRKKLKNDTPKRSKT